MAAQPRHRSRLPPRRLLGALRRAGHRHRRARLRLRQPLLPPNGSASAGWPGCSRCSPARCSAWSWPTTCSCSTRFWELTSVTSYLLIGNDHEDRRARAAALQALLVTSAGGLAMLGGFVLLGQAAGTYRLSELVAAPPGGTTVPWRSSSSSSGPSPSRRSTRSTPGCPAPWWPDTGQRLPALGHDGEGRRVPRRPVRSGLRRGRSLAADPGRGRPRHHGGRRPARPAPARPQAPARLRHGQPARLHDGAVRGRRPRPPAAGCVLLLAHALFKAALFMVVGTIDHETGTRDAAPAPAASARAGAWSGGHGRRRGVDGRRASRVRVRGQGGGATTAPEAGGFAARRAGARGRGARLDPHRRLQPPLRPRRRRRRPLCLVRARRCGIRTTGATEPGR